MNDNTNKLASAIRYSRGRDKFDNFPHQDEAADFDEFRKTVLHDRARVKGKQYVAAPFAPDHGTWGKNDKPCNGRPRRCEKGAQPRQFLAFDFDRIKDQETFHSLINWFQTINGFAYTTASHMPDAPRARIIVELSRAVNRKEGMRLGLALQNAIERDLGASVFDFDESVYRGEQPCYCPPVNTETYTFDGQPVDVDTRLQTAPAIEEKQSGVDREEVAGVSDPMFQSLDRQGMVKSRARPGRYNIECPCSEQHTGNSGETAVQYFLPNYEGVKYGKVHCLHQHCENRPQEEFIQAMGLDPHTVWAAQTGRAETLFDFDEAKPVFAPQAVPASLLTDIIDLAPRDWIANNILLRGYITAMFSPGGVGKSVWQIALALSVALGEDCFLDVGCKSGKVLLINNEDDEAELKRRIASNCQYWGTAPEELTDRFFYFSGYGAPIMLAQQASDGSIVRTADFDEIKTFIIEKGIDVLFVDPFISTHNIPETDNTAIDKVITIYKRLAHECNISICLIHHTKKLGSDSEIHAGDAEAGRGASSLKDAARIVVTLAKMNAKTGEQLNLNNTDRARYVRLDTGKLNFGLADYDAKWFKMESEALVNGDWVGVPAPAEMDHLFEKARTEDGRVKWSATIVAAAVEKIFPKKKPTEQWTNIREKFKTENEISNSQAGNKITLDSKESKDPTRICVNGNYIDFHISKANTTSPWVVHRQELS